MANSAVKYGITEALKNAVQQVESRYTNSEDDIRSDDLANQLCSVLEAMFLHGLKSPIKSRFSRLLSNENRHGNIYSNFWPFLQCYIHNIAISDLRSMDQLKTDIGFCRAWVRMSLNDKVFENYLQCIISDPRSCSNFYKTNAYMRDLEYLEIAKNYLLGLENLNFKLSVNSCILNEWSITPLVLCGIITQSKCECTHQDAIPRAVRSKTSKTPSELSDASGSISPAPLCSDSSPSTSTPTSCRRCRRRSSPSQAPPNTPSMAIVNDQQRTSSILSTSLANSEMSEPDPIDARLADILDHYPVYSSPTGTLRLSIPESHTSSQNPLSPSPLIIPSPVGSAISGSGEDDPDLEHGPRIAHPVHTGTPVFRMLDTIKDEINESQIADGLNIPATDNVGHVETDGHQGSVKSSSSSSSSFLESRNPFTMQKVPESGSVARVGCGGSSGAGDNVELSHSEDEESCEEIDIYNEIDVSRLTASRSTATDESASIDAVNDNDLYIEEPEVDSIEDTYNRSIPIGSPLHHNSSTPLHSGSSPGTPLQPKLSSVHAYCSIVEQSEEANDCDNYDQMICEDTDTDNIELSPESSIMSLKEELVETNIQGNSLAGFKGWSSANNEEYEENSTSLAREESSISPESAEDVVKSLECSVKPSLSEQELQMIQLGHIAQEVGLDTQQYQCHACTRPIGLFYGKERLCGFDGHYYCCDCQSDQDTNYIPAKVVQNWHFKKFLVSKKNKAFLVDVFQKPLLNIQQLNHRLYDHVVKLKQIRCLRIQLCYLRPYLFTCKQSIADEFRQKIPSHLYDHIDLYSLSDLLEIQAGSSFENNLKMVIKFAKKHVFNCQLCQQKGFICEICHKTPNIYPFQLDITTQCDKCNSVFHRGCRPVASTESCLRCLRLKARKDHMEAVLLDPMHS